MRGLCLPVQTASHTSPCKPARQEPSRLYQLSILEDGEGRDRSGTEMDDAQEDVRSLESQDRFHRVEGEQRRQPQKKGAVKIYAVF